MDLFLFYIPFKGKDKIDAGKTPRSVSQFLIFGNVIYWLRAVLVNFGFLKNIRTYFKKATYGPQNPVDGDKKNCLTPSSVGLRKVWLRAVLANCGFSNIKFIDSVQC